MDQIKFAFQQLNQQLTGIRYDLFALTSAVQNQPSMDKDRLEQDFLTARSQFSDQPFPTETDALLTVLSTRDGVTPPRTLADMRLAFASLRQDHAPPE